MNAILDTPGASESVDPVRFQVRGWIWAGELQSEIAEIEGWSEGVRLGGTSRFVERADVVVALELPPMARPGFDFFVSAPSISPGRGFAFSLRVRWRSGDRTESFAGVQLTSLDLGMDLRSATSRSAVPTHEDRAPRWLSKNSAGGGHDFGVEIGAFKSPIPGIHPLYLDRFPEYDYVAVSADYVADAASLPVRSDTLDYVANANVFEHLANPVAALWEWARACRDGGIIYLVVPDRRLTFDRFRPLTTPEHMIEDYDRGTTDSDGTHVLDYIDGVDWSLWAPSATAAERITTRETLRVAYVAAVAAHEPINIHFHTFELASFAALVRLMNRHPKRPCALELVDASEFFPESHPSGFLVVLRVQKDITARLLGRWKRLCARGEARAAMTPKAVPFSSAAKG